ncbi:MAG: BON domain-containing protein [Anaerolineales bacterium]|nr:BON domain-containing protein [Anaerolineales bacterium]
MDDRDMRDYGIEVLDNNGVVTLKGTVPTPAARDRAEEPARSMEA